MGPIQHRLAELAINADANAWHEVGFNVTVGRCRIGEVELAYTADQERPTGLRGWTIAGLAVEADLGGIPTQHDHLPVSPGGRASPHPCGVIGIDHVVLFSSALEKTIASFEDAGVRCRRRREGAGPGGHPLEQAFFRLGSVIVEAVGVANEHAGPDGSRLWGITFCVADLDEAVAQLGKGRMIGSPKDAVQPGRRIATVRKQAGLGLPVALISPEPTPT